MRAHTFYLAPLAIFALQGCATAAPSPELVNARAAYSRAQSGAPAALDPAQLHEAKTALDKAEAANADDPTAPETIDLAVVASLKTAKSEAIAVAIQAANDKARAQAEVQALQKAQLASARSDARYAQNQAQNAQAQAQNANADASRTREQLEAERQKRLEVEGHLKSALATIDRIASVKDSDRGLVVSFQGDALFKTGEWKLRPEAMAKLSQIADSLKEQERRIDIEGHTDNQGGAGAYNQDLSEKRANAVRDFLLTKGIPSDLIHTAGFGPTRPVAENTTAEGRAANRRIEIIVAPKQPR